MAAPVEIAAAGAVDADQCRETEWQLSAMDLTCAHAWLAEHRAIDGFTIEPRPAQSMYDTYLDTEDWRVRRAGYALRLRDLPGEVEATLKELAPAVGGISSRHEFNQNVAASDENFLARNEGPVSLRVQAVAGERPLRPLFRVRTRRQRFAVLSDNRECGEIALDDTIVASPDGRSKVYLRRVEVEARTAEPQALEGLIDRLRTECSLQPAVGSKYDVGLMAAGVGPLTTQNLGPTQIDSTFRIAEVARARLRRQMSSWLECEPGARLGESRERLEELLLAVRGLDDTLRMFAAHLPQAWVHLRVPLKDLVRALGRARDLDARLAELDGFAQALGEVEMLQVQPARNLVAADRFATRQKMLRELDRPSTHRLMSRFRAQLAEVSEGEAESPFATDVAPSLIRERYRKLRDDASRLNKGSKAGDFHLVLRRVERLRNAIGAFAAIYGDAAHEMLRTLAKVRDLLRFHQDAGISAQHAQELAGGGSALPAETTFLLGRFFEDRQASAARLRRRVQKVESKIQGRRWKALRQVMTQLAATRTDEAGGTIRVIE